MFHGRALNNIYIIEQANKFTSINIFYFIVHYYSQNNSNYIIIQDQIKYIY